MFLIGYSACPNGQYKTCTTCSGNGTVSSTTTCTNCSGSGKITCTNCSGSGTIKTSNNCTHGFGPNSSHYYCPKHGNSVSQYH